MKVTAIERVSASWASTSQERANTPVQRVAHLTSETADTTSAVSESSRHIPVLPVSYNRSLRPTDDATVAYAQRKESQARQGQESVPVFGPLPANANATQALNQAYGHVDGAAMDLAHGVDAKPNANAADQATEPPKEPLSKQLMELVTNLWAASRAAVDAVHPPEPTPAPPPAQPANGPSPQTAALLNAPTDRRQRGSDGAATGTANPVNKTYNTRSRAAKVHQQA